MNAIKHKLGPLPLWAWVIIAGGTLGVVLYMRNRTPSTAAPSPSTGTTGDVLDSTAGAPPDTGAGGGGTSSPATDPTLIPTTPTGDSGASIDDVYNALLGLQADVSALAGGQGLTDQTTGTDQSPSQTFLGEITDVTAGVKALQQLGMLTPQQAANAHKKSQAAKKKSQGSGQAGKVGQHHKPARRTVQHQAAKPATPRRQSHQPAKAVRKTSGGNRAKHRTPAKHR